MIIGIQGDKGSWNEKACKKFCEQKNIKSYQIKYLLSTQNVLRELDGDKINLGIFAVSSQGLLVDETKEVIEKHKFTKVSEITLNIELLTLANKNVKDISRVFGHSQTFKFIQEEIESLYPDATLVPTDGKNMFDNQLQNNEALIGNSMYEEIYNLRLVDKLKTKYETKFYIVKKPI